MFAGNNYVIFINEEDYKTHIKLNYIERYDYFANWNAYINIKERPIKYPCSYKYYPSLEGHFIENLEPIEIAEAKVKIDEIYNEIIKNANNTIKHFSLKKEELQKI